MSGPNGKKQDTSTYTHTQFQNTKALGRHEIPHSYIPCAHILQRNERWCFMILLDHPSHPSPQNNHHQILWKKFHYQLQEGINCIQTMGYASRILFNNWLCIGGRLRCMKTRSSTIVIPSSFSSPCECVQRHTNYAHTLKHCKFD